VAMSLHPLAQFFGESFHLAHGHDAYPFPGEKFLDEHMPRIFRIRRHVRDGCDFREPVVRVDAPSGISESLRLR